MKIAVVNLESEMEIYNGDGEMYLEMNDNDMELEVALNKLDGNVVDKVCIEYDDMELEITKEIELLYD